MNKQTLEKFTRARASLILDQPFFGSLALRLLPVPDESIKTMATDGRRLKFNPNFVDKISLGQTKAEICHEVMHCVLDHVGRRGARNPQKWNIAADHAINPTLKDLGFELGDDWLLDMQFKDMSADAIYNMLPDPPDDGSGPSDLEDGQSDAPPLTPKEQLEWKVATLQAANAAKTMGKLPGSLEKFVEELTNPKVDWRTVLRRFITERAKNDYSWMRPNRRMLSNGIYLPSLYSEKMGPMVLIKDISMSIDDEVQDAFNAECRAAVQDTMPEEVHSLYVDTHVRKADLFTDPNAVEFENIHGGGTDFRPPFNYVEEHGIKPVCAIYLTDLEGLFPAQEPDYPVLWVTINNHVAPWGETVRIEV